MRLQYFIPSAAALLVGAVSVYASSLHASSELRTRQSVFRSQVQNDTCLRYVANSGICETTPGVTQYSGYIDVRTNMSMWFWFFEARNSPETAPFTLWLNSFPICSSMIGLFQENGPCLVNADGNSTYLNPYSWNNVSNMIYIDQPIGTGFSYGTDTVNSTEAAAPYPYVWKAFQILFESKLFSKYASREFILATESFGGHYGPGFVTYFDEQNALIAKGAIQGEPVVVSALMINNGWYDPLIQNIAYYTFTSNAPGYGQLQPDDVLKNISAALYGPNGCVAQQKNCSAAGNSTDSDKICSQADDYCGNHVTAPAFGDRDPDDLRQNSSALFPPVHYVTYLTNPEVMSTIGAESGYQPCPDASYELFVKTGDGARAWLPQLSELANSRLKILIWAGDADINCNWIGGYKSVLAMDWYGNETLHNTPLGNITLNGKPIAAVANIDNFTFARVFEAGHFVPAFQPAAALEIFTQVVNKEPLHSV
ncbi:Alpha/Beta hydrolase protein [Boletus reticuloceps]|uniref:Alpha/Beta hydrolase protein n=1 Tax=Boletus reticuloceps TaxID=495285 RepID=A0A8I3ACF6_9AGAM|nr:Alpha/Beta hydrolase protein [Boletus reticuloceps]